MGNAYFGQQEYAKAIKAYNKALTIDPNFSSPYNQLGYAYRFSGNYEDSKTTFQKYIELTPNDPNPYDSYAELLLKLGEYDASIQTYQKGLDISPNFVASHIGIATNLNYKNQHANARNQLQKLYAIARNDGERRATHFALTVSYVSEGNLEQALAEQEKQFNLAQKINDPAAMSGDLATMGNILLEAGKPDRALEKFNLDLKTVENSDLSEQVKENTRQDHLFNTARVALAK